MGLFGLCGAPGPAGRSGFGGSGYLIRKSGKRRGQDRREKSHIPYWGGGTAAGVPGKMPARPFLLESFLSRRASIPIKIVPKVNRRSTVPGCLFPDGFTLRPYGPVVLLLCVGFFIFINPGFSAFVFAAEFVDIELMNDIGCVDHGSPAEGVPGVHVVHVIKRQPVVIINNASFVGCHIS